MVDIQYKTERAWILSLIADGLREHLDYKICEKRFAVKILLTFYDSALADNQTQVTIHLSASVEIDRRAEMLSLVAYKVENLPKLKNRLISVCRKKCSFRLLVRV